MASEKIRAQKQEVVNEIVSKLDNNDTAVIFEYQGLSVDQIAKLRKDLRDINGEVKIYYGASDTVECLATANVDELIELCIK